MAGIKNERVIISGIKTGKEKVSQSRLIKNTIPYCHPDHHRDLPGHYTVRIASLNQ